jgi:hypothetical protein
MGANRRTITEQERIELMAEVGYIQARAAENDSRVVSISDLLLFSARNGDAWLLDTSDRLAMRLAEFGRPLEISVEEKGESFAIHWPGRYRIDGTVFIYVDETAGGLESFNGYPVQQIAKKGKKEAPPLLAADRETLDLLRRMRGNTGR